MFQRSFNVQFSPVSATTTTDFYQNLKLVTIFIVWAPWQRTFLNISVFKTRLTNWNKIKIEDKLRSTLGKTKIGFLCGLFTNLPSSVSQEGSFFVFTSLLRLLSHDNNGYTTDSFVSNNLNSKSSIRGARTRSRAVGEPPRCDQAQSHEGFHHQLLFNF